MATFRNTNQAETGFNFELSIMRDEAAAKDNFIAELNPVYNPPHTKHEIYSVSFEDPMPFDFANPARYEIPRAELNDLIRAGGLVADLTTKLGGSPFTSRHTISDLLKAIKDLIGSPAFSNMLMNNFKECFTCIHCADPQGGDPVAVVFSAVEIKRLERLHGCSYPQIVQSLHKRYTNIIFGQPVRGCFLVSAGDYAETFDLSEYLEDAYEYNRALILEGFNQFADCPLEAGEAAYRFLAENLPEKI